ncbi:2-iminoacetate synthase ThiH [Pleomorphovibrio marinus]|uniref:2-iminoacetate synthase ThiH n=1 Tax=Pleomorphovibrio marinus TaxID=2164132 RepID=UPI000E0AC96B|nr:2-iminoacetate synthase ThiH [Pleomorphovibrio marinus]
MNSFLQQFQKTDWLDIQRRIYGQGNIDVKRALAKKKRDLTDLMALLSPEAMPYLEEMAQISQKITQERFGKTIQLFAPMYVSNECQNICTYCGFSFTNQIPRKTLTEEELLQEASILKKLGFNHVLIVSGEANYTVNINYFSKAVALLRKYFANISIEVQPLSQEEYQKLNLLGVHSVLVYQETYHREIYKTYHPKGKKANFDYRLTTPDRIGKAGIHKIGLGVLLGLADWRTDSLYCALHLDYLQKTYWRSKYSLSFPRMRPAEGIDWQGKVMSDRELVQLICAYRLWNPDLELSLSTRESEVFRDHAISLGVTSMSAGSKTNPGGYSAEEDSLEQFSIDDNRSPKQISKIISSKGYDPVWKDWEILEY